LTALSLKTEILDERQVVSLLEIAEKKPAEAEKVLIRARRLRESIYRLYKAAAENWQPESGDLSVLNRELDFARRHQRLTSTQGSNFAFEWIDKTKSLDSMLWQIAESAAKFLVEGDVTRIRQCGSENCNWLFLDATRNRSRQWCDMKDCGNLAKVRRFRRKQRYEVESSLTRG
jgi:predicted RNA-binding Zn ribbon-like protein